MLKALWAAFTASKWDLILSAIAISFAAGGYLGWHEKSIRVDAEDNAALKSAVVTHTDQENKSQKIGEETEHAKANAKIGFEKVVKSNAPVCIITPASVHEQDNLIATGEAQLHRHH